MAISSWFILVSLKELFTLFCIEHRSFKFKIIWSLLVKKVFLKIKDFFLIVTILMVI